jgi:hypothetical protein
MRAERIYNRWFFGTRENKEEIQRKKRREIYAARVHLIKHLVGLSDQSKRKMGKNCYSSSFGSIYNIIYSYT